MTQITQIFGIGVELLNVSRLPYPKRSAKSAYLWTALYLRHLWTSFSRLHRYINQLINSLAILCNALAASTFKLIAGLFQYAH